MKRTQTPRPDRRALRAAGGAWLPRLRSLSLLLLALLALSTGVLGYQIGRGENNRLKRELGMPPLNRVQVASLQPTQAPTTLFDRLSLFGSVQNQEGQPAADTSVSLLQGGHMVASGEAGSFAFTELMQGEYTLRVTPKGAQPLEAALSIVKTQRMEQASLTRGEDGRYTLMTAPSASSAALQLNLEENGLTLALSGEEPIGLKAYQLWERETQVHLFDERLGNQVVGSKDGISVAAPGSGGSFIFVVENPDPFPQECRIVLREEYVGTLRLPMRYRLRDDVLRIQEEEWGEWQKAEDILIPSVWVAPGELRYYTLQWMWDPSDNALDTAIGTRAEDYSYRLHVDVIQTIPLPHNLRL